MGQPTSAAFFVASASQRCTLSPNQAYHLGMSQYLQNTDAHFFDYPAAANFFLRDEPDEDEEEEPKTKKKRRRRRRGGRKTTKRMKMKTRMTMTRMAMTAIRSELALRA